MGDNHPDTGNEVKGIKKRVRNEHEKVRDKMGIASAIVMTFMFLYSLLHK
jgi:hypothetical protein